MTNTCTKVFLRRRPYVGGKVSLYLDYYPAIRNPHTNKMTRRETLGIVIYAEPANEMQRRFNQEMEEKAEAISVASAIRALSTSNSGSLTRQN